MRAQKRRLLRDDRGANELLGFALLIVLVVLGLVVVLGDLGTQITTRLTEIRDGL